MEIYVVLIDVTYKGIWQSTEMYSEYYTSYEVAEQKLIEDDYKLDEYNEYVKYSGRYTYEAEIVALIKGE